MATPDIDQDYELFLKLLAQRIRQLRKERGLTLRDMVIKHGYHDSQWRRMERNGVGGVQSLLRIASVFNISLAELLSDLSAYPKKALSECVSERCTTKNYVDN